MKLLPLRNAVLVVGVGSFRIEPRARVIYGDRSMEDDHASEREMINGGGGLGEWQPQK